MNQPICLSLNQSRNGWMNELINLSMNHRISLPDNESMNKYQSIYERMNESINQSTHKPMNETMNKSINQTICTQIDTTYWYIDYEPIDQYTPLFSARISSTSFLAFITRFSASAVSCKHYAKLHWINDGL